MFGLEGLIWLGVSGGAALYGFIKSRKFVRSKLRFVDAVHNPVVPLAAGLVTALAAAALGSLVSILPLINLGIGTGLLVGFGVGTGVLSGSKDVKRLPPG